MSVSVGCGGDGKAGIRVHHIDLIDSRRDSRDVVEIKTQRKGVGCRPIDVENEEGVPPAISTSTCRR